MSLLIKTLCLSSLLLPTYVAQAETAALAQTKIKLKQLETKISNLQHTLNSDHDKNSLLNQELAETEKKISRSVHQLRHTQLDVTNKQQKITAIQRQIHALNDQLLTQQDLLAKHVRARYMMGEYQPLQWLLNQDSPYTTSRLLTYYQYIIQSRQSLIENIQATRKNITVNQEKLHQEINEKLQLQQQLSKNQQKLEQNKLYSTTVIRALSQDIQNKKKALEDYQQNKANLSKLLKTLVQQSIIQTQHPLLYKYKKLPRPVAVHGNNLQNLNQGVVFFAMEGTPVMSVFPGKVVFSDWLKGYGLLLIIDHGRGFMTLYAHNQSLYKQKGDTVDQSEQIATVGHSGGLKQNGLYFEIRERGKAIPPLKWLS